MCVIAAGLECLPEKSSWCRNEQVCHGRKSVKRFERSNGFDTSLYKNMHLLYQNILLVAGKSLTTRKGCNIECGVGFTGKLGAVWRPGD